MSYLIVRRLTVAVALLLVLVAAPALAASGPTSAHRPHTLRVPIVTGVSLLDQLLDWLGIPAPGDRVGVRGTHEKSGTRLPLNPGDVVVDPLLDNADHGPMIDPNG
ncbi:MAG: hypothetical protein QOF89_3011 [Acidobacteriota bacterium]|nr:hypothetical protein [Acidobacteriota bacterium]